MVAGLMRREERHTFPCRCLIYEVELVRKELGQGALDASHRIHGHQTSLTKCDISLSIAEGQLRNTDLDFLCPQVASLTGSLGHPSCLGVDRRTHRCTEAPDCSLPKAVADLAEMRTGKEADPAAAAGQADAPR